MARLCNACFTAREIPEELRREVVVPIWKGKQCPITTANISFEYVVPVPSMWMKYWTQKPDAAISESAEKVTSAAFCLVVMFRGSWLPQNDPRTGVDISLPSKMVTLSLEHSVPPASTSKMTKCRVTR